MPPPTHAESRAVITPHSASADRPVTRLKCASCGVEVKAVGWKEGMAATCKHCGGALRPVSIAPAPPPEAPEDPSRVATKAIPAPDPLVGRNIGGCQIQRKLGSGGMGSVYAARHLALDKTVAIKILPPEYVAHRSAVERFQREARAAAKLEHPNIVQVLNVGLEDGFNYIVMQYVEGLSLGKLVAQRKAPLPWQEALKYVRDAARGLASAHKVGIVHRDIKPDNVLVTTDGVAKVADFGLARTLDSNLTLSTTGQIMGTPDYMSPEQAQAFKTDGRADIYSLGATLYFLLTARKPYFAETPVAIILKHVSENPKPVREVNPAVPEALANVVSKMMAKKPEDRFPDCAALVAALDEVEKGGAPISASDIPPIAAGASGEGSSPSVPSQIVLESGWSAKNFVALGAGIAAVFLFAMIVVAMVKKGRGGNEEAAPADGEAPARPTDPGQPPGDSAAELLRHFNRLKSSVESGDWKAAAEAAEALEKYRDLPEAQAIADPVKEYFKAVKSHEARVAAGKIVEFPGGERWIWEFDDATDLEEFDRPLSVWTKFDKGALTGTGVLQSRDFQARDGAVSIRFRFLDTGKSDKRERLTGDRPKFRPGESETGPHFGIAVRVRESGEGYALGYEFPEGAKPRLSLALLKGKNLQPGILRSAELAGVEGEQHLEFRFADDKLNASLNGTPVLEATDARVAGAGGIALVARGLRVKIERIEMERKKE